MEFNSDGSLQLPENAGVKSVEDLELFDEDTPFVTVLKLISELRFPLGKKLISETLRGTKDAKTKKLRLDILENFGGLDLYDNQDIFQLLDEMIHDGLIEVQRAKSSKFLPIIAMTSKGKTVMYNPSSFKKKDVSKNNEVLANLSPITEKDRQLFSAFGGYLEKYNDEQKKAIIEDSKNILCIAGAGSGKTTVLTRRIDFLVRMRNVDPSRILAITFTRKAKQEMMNRLGDVGVRIETFNSFCEKMLKQYEQLFYGREFKVMDFKSRVKLFTSALNKIGYGPESAVDKYFLSKRGKNERTLFFNLMNDVFSLIDYYKNNGQNFSKFKECIHSYPDPKNQHRALFVYKVVEKLLELKEHHGFRDYTDQLVHTIELFKEHKDVIPQYDHILVDEYQDVNDIQVNLLELLGSENLFVVGDPRQSIYGWRGSKIKHILKFPETKENCAVIQLTKNYRSTNNIVKIGNRIITPMKLPDLESGSNLIEKEAIMLRHKDDKSESLFIAQSILSTSISRKEIFILSRTNKQLDKVAEALDGFDIKYLKRTTDDTKQNVEPDEFQVTLSTVHAIKGLEASLVYLIGVNSKNYPCLVSDHPVIDMAKMEDSYDKEDEELRLLYVGATRAKNQLVLNYHGKLSKFVNSDLKKMFNFVDNGLGTATGHKKDLMTRLKDWRMMMAKESNLLPYMVMPDRVFEQLVTKMPDSVVKLHDINGLGPTKISKYGEELLNILNGM